MVTGHRGHRPARVRPRAGGAAEHHAARPSSTWRGTGCTRATAGGSRATTHGAGVFKIDWILSEPVPWTNPDVRRAGTIHVAGTLDETIAGERAPNQGRLTDQPYVLAVQPTVPDPSRAPEGGHIFWAYVHVPHGADVDMTEAIENQIERFAPGFRDTVVERYTKNAVQMEAVEPQLPRRGHLQRPGHRSGRCWPGRCRAGTPTRRRCAGCTSPRRPPRRARRCTGLRRQRRPGGPARGLRGQEASRRSSPR